MAEKKAEYKEYNLVVLGDIGVGKTALTIQLCCGFYGGDFDPTGDSYRRKLAQIDGISCLLEVIENTGQEQMRNFSISRGDAFMLVYSISSRSSFTRILQFHAEVMRIRKSQMKSDPSMCLVGNKCDRVAGREISTRGGFPLEIEPGYDFFACDRVTEREVSTREGIALAKELGCDFFEISSKNYVEVEASFYGLVRAMRKQRTAVLQDEHRYQPQNQKSSRFSSLTGLFRSPKSPDNNPRSLDATQQMSLNRLLAQAAQRDKRKTTKRLLEIGADPNGDSGADESPLYAAAALGHLRMATLLLDSGAAVEARKTRGSTPLTIAAAEGHVAVVETLLARGASTDVHSDTHGTPLIAATFRCHSKVLKALLLHGAKVNEKGGQYGTALHTVATAGNANIAKILLDAGADVTLRDQDNCTALHVAAAAGHAEIVRLLLLRGAHSLIDDTQGKYGSALKAAKDRSRFDVMKVLLDAGANEETLSIATPLASTPSDAGISDGPAAAKLNDGILTGGVQNVSPGLTNGSQDLVEDDLLHEVANTRLLDWISTGPNPNADHQPSSPGIPVLTLHAPSADADLDHASQHEHLHQT